MKNLFIIFVLFSVTRSYSFGQGLTQLPEEQIQDEKYDTILSSKKLDYSFNTGVSFSTGAFKGSMYYVAPSINYQFSSKFSLHTSIAFMRSNLSPSNTQLNLGDQSRLFDNRQSAAIISASGDYQLNDKILISGSVVKSFNLTGQSNTENRVIDNKFQMLSLGLQYKISPKVTLGTDIRMIQGNIYNPVLFGMGNNYHWGMPFYGL